MKELELEELEETKIDKSNIFYRLFGPTYADLFNKIYYASLKDRDDYVTKLKDTYQNDSKLTDRQKQLLATCYMATICAVGKNSTTLGLPMLTFLNKTPINFDKFTNEKRFNRCIDDLYMLCKRIGYHFDCYMLPQLLKSFTMSFGYMRKDIPEKDRMYNLDFEHMTVVALSRYARRLSPYDLSNMWYILIFMKNIATMSYIHPSVYNSFSEEKKKEIQDMAKNLIYLMNFINYKNKKRKGELSDDQEVNSSVTSKEDNQESNELKNEEPVLIEPEQ